MVRGNPRTPVGHVATIVESATLVFVQRVLLLGPDDDRVPGGYPVVAISEAFWRRQMGGNAGAVGRKAVAARLASPASFQRMAAQPSGEITV